MLGVGRVYSGFWKRFAAYLIDSIVLTGGYILFFIIWVGFELLMDTIGVEESNKRFILGTLGFPMYFLIPLFYYALSESSNKMATVGKVVLGIVVVDSQQKRISFGKAVARYFARILSALPLLIGFIMAGLTKNKQALHDILCGTYVIDLNSMKRHENHEIK